MNDWEDRAIDAALRELHGSEPPDLSARVLAALAPNHAGPLPRLAPRAARSFPLAALLLAAAMLGFAASFAASMLFDRGSPASGAVPVSVHVLRGEVVCVESGSERTVRAGSTRHAPFSALRGNRLRTRPPATFVLESFGRLDTGPDTELEVRSMEFTKKHGFVAASSLTLGVVAGAVTWHAITRQETARAGEVLRVHAGELAGDATLATENQRLRERLAALEQQHQALLASTARRDAAPDVPPAPAANDQPPAAPAPAADALAFGDPRFAAALAKIDWAKVGAVTHEMGPLLAKLAEAMATEGEETPVDLAVKVTELNTALIAQVPAMLESGLPGFGPNGTYTHPLIAANTLASTLAAAGQQLTANQQRQIDGLVRSFSVEAQSIADSQTDFALEQLLAETAMKERFFDEVGSLLAPEQHAAVFPDGAKAYEGASLFDTGVMMRVHAEPVVARDAADFARIVSGKVGEKLGLDEATTAQVRAVLAQASNDPELWRDRAGAKERQPGHFLKSGRTRTALRHQLEWMRQIQRQVALTPEQRRELARMATVMVPLPR